MWEIKAQFDGMSYSDGKYHISFVTDSIDGKPEKFGEDYYTLKVSKYYAPKSKRANDYYWTLCTKLSKELSKETYTSVARIHNKNLRTMWNELLVSVDGSPKMEIIPNTDKAEQDVLEDMDYHLMPVPYSVMKNPVFTNSKGKEFRYYFALRGVRQMNNKEISKLIDIVIQECLEVGNIETKTPNQLLELERYEK